MKIRYYIESAVAVSLLLTACSQEVELPQPEETTPAQEVRIGATLGSETTRLGMTETEESLVLKWTESDKLHVLNPLADNEITTFTINQGVGERGAIFTGTPQTAYQEGQKLYTIYNQHDNTILLNEDGDVILDISQQTGKLDERFMYMWGETYYSEGNASFQLKPITCILKVNLELPVGVEELSSVSLYNVYYTTRAAFNIDGSKYGVEGGFITEKDSESSNKIEITGSFQKTPGTNTVTVYFYAFSCDRIGFEEYEDGTVHYYNGGWGFGNLKINATDIQGNTVISSTVYGDKHLQAGKEYELNCSMVAPVKFANEDTVEGTTADPYKISNTDQFYSLMLRSAHNLTNAQGNSYRGCSYVLTSDIVLDNRYKWEPINLINMTFDGNNHVISGNQDMAENYGCGIFSAVQWCTIKNLTINANINFGTKIITTVGGFMDYATSSTLENCHNRSQITANCLYIGGLAGNIDNCTVIGCSNTADLNFLAEGHTYPELYVGGLAATSENTEFKACYSIASINLLSTNRETIKIGGLVGRDFANSQFTSCWSEGILHGPANFGSFISQAENTQFKSCFSNEYECNLVNSGYWNGSLSSFSGSIPTVEQIASMNVAISDTGYKFMEDGTLKKEYGIFVPDMPKKEL